MRILFVASEVDPFAKTGGLADVAGALPKALAELGHDVRVILPLYQSVDRRRWNWQPTSIAFSVPAAARAHQVRLWQTSLPGSQVIVYGVECAALFDRQGLYQDAGKDYPDNLERFSVFAQAALRGLPAIEWQPSVVHGHDWQAALACVHLRLGRFAQESFFSSMASVFTVHNLAYQGMFPRSMWPLTELPESAYSLNGLEFYGQLSCLKGGLVCADIVTTVSPTYAREILSPEAGCGLEGVLAMRREDLLGILNGIDPQQWDPEHDPHLAAHYSVEKPAGKSLCKLALQKSQGLPERHDLLIGMIQRLVEQKGIDRFVAAIEELMAHPLQIVILGTGEAAYHRQLTQLARDFPDRLAVNLTFDNALAHQIEAGADAFLMPSRFEPCGLNQMYSMRFGAVPIVTRVVGLADTVVDVTPQTMAAQTATGFVLAEDSSRALVEAVARTVAAFRDHAMWTALMRAGMRKDCSWRRSAQTYVDVYERALARRLTGLAR